MSEYVISEMTPNEISAFKNKYRSLKPFMPLFKVLLDGHWHYGFISREQAEFAMEHRSTPAESFYFKDDSSFTPTGRPTVHF